MEEICWETVNMIAYGRVENVVNRDLDGRVLGNSLEKMLEILLKRDTILMGESMKYTGLIQKLNKQGGEKSKKRPVEKRTSTPLTKRRRSVTPSYESDEEISHDSARSSQSGYGSDQEGHHKQRNDDKQVEEENYDEDGSEYDIDGDECDGGHDSEKEDPDDQPNISIPQTPHYPKPTSQNRKNVNLSTENTTIAIGDDNDTDSDSFDHVADEDVTANDPLGDIIPSIRRVVLKGSNKNYYGIN